ncbi:MAG: haloacid dehalogenase-like hydrolase, partial [Thermoleophilia bacterium]|nr:haloacid dehalogenase-like hydrolase [Thermoleophilia bacterium]
MTVITLDRTFDGARGAAFFDVDRTLVGGASGLTMVKPFQRRGLVTRRQTIRAGLAQLAYTARGADDQGIERTYVAVKELMKGWDVELMRRVISEELESRLHPTVVREALERVVMHHRQGQAVYAVSATMIDLIEPIAELLGLEGALGTEMEIVDGHFTGEVLKP